MIIDDHTLIREICSTFLNLNEGFRVVAGSGDTDEAIVLAEKNSPDIILLDINMPVHNGFEMIGLLQNSSPFSRIIGLSVHAEPEYAKKMIKAGARGYLTKNTSIREMTTAIHEVNGGKVFICNEIKNLLADLALNDHADTPGLHLLTERETTILHLLKTGSTSKEIAAQLELSITTVNVHRNQILKKLNMKNMIEAVAYLNAQNV